MNFFYADGGALVCDEPIKGITQDVLKCSYYGGHRYFVGESMSKEAARRIAHAMGGTLIDGIGPSHQLSAATIDISREVTRLAFYGEHARKRSHA